MGESILSTNYNSTRYKLYYTTHNLKVCSHVCMALFGFTKAQWSFELNAVC